MTVDNDLDALRYKGNLLESQRDIEILAEDTSIATVSPETVSELTGNFGDMYAGRFLAIKEGSTSLEPTDVGYIGSFMSAEGEQFGLYRINVGASKNGLLSVGFNDEGDLVAGFGDVLVNEDGITILGEQFPSINPLRWIADDDGNSLGKILSFYVTGTSSGLYMIGDEKIPGLYGVAGLAAQGNDQTLGQYRMLFQVDSKDGGRAFIEHNVSGTNRRSYLPATGWLPYAMQEGASQALSFGNNFAIPASGGAIAFPVTLVAPMMLQSVTLRNNDSSNGHTWNWYLYEQMKQTGDAGENSLSLKANGAAAETWTASGATFRTIAAANAPLYLAPGIYWMVIQNQHASQTFSIATNNAGVILHNSAQSKTLSIPPGDPLDFVAATWTKRTAMYEVVLEGDVFGQNTIF